MKSTDKLQTTYAKALSIKAYRDFESHPLRHVLSIIFNSYNSEIPKKVTDKLQITTLNRTLQDYYINKYLIFLLYLLGKLAMENEKGNKVKYLRSANYPIFPWQILGKTWQIVGKVDDGKKAESYKTSDRELQI